MERNPPDPSDTDSFGAYQAARRLLTAAGLLGLALPAVFAIQGATILGFVSVTSVGLAIVGASLGVGGLLGFVFGIPRLLQDARPPTREETGEVHAEDRRAPYAGNTSLEQISDWLTKILVGVGLTQLANIPSGLVALGDFLAPGLGGFAGAHIFGAGLVVYSLLDGFFLGYLWTRLYLPSLFAESDVRALVASARESGVQQGERKALDATSAAVATAEAAPKTKGLGEAPLSALWVDDNPDNNSSEMQLMQSVLGIQFETRPSTDAAMEELEANSDKYAFVITDMGRDWDRRAGYTLLKRMRDRGIETPLIIYASSGRPEDDAEARKRGAVGSTNSPSRLLEMVSQVIQGQGKP